MVVDVDWSVVGRTRGREHQALFTVKSRYYHCLVGMVLAQRAHQREGMDDLLQAQREIAANTRFQLNLNLQIRL
jgi:hypothetical protein